MATAPLRTPTVYNPVPTNYEMTTLQCGDFNGDGWPDVALEETGPENRVHIFLNVAGNLVERVSYPVGATPAGLTLGDLNGDGILDFAVANFQSNSVIVYYGTGLGTFSPGGTYSVGTGPTSIAIGDINADGFADLAVLRTNGVTLLLGNAGHTFTPGGSVYEAGATSVGLGVFGGPHMDLVIASNQWTADNTGVLSHLTVYPGNRSGQFPSHKVYSTGWDPAQLLVADLNGDGHLDIAVGDAVSPEIDILYGDGFGSFSGTPVAMNPRATGIASADFNRDNTPDIAVVNTPACAAPCSGAVSVMLGTGQNYLGAAHSYAIGMHGAGAVAGDVNGDGLIDLVVTNNTAGDSYDTSVLLGNGDGTFNTAKNYNLGALSSEAILFDVNGDHKLDLVMVTGVALGKGDGTFGAVIPYPDITYGLPSHVAVADFNQDGFPDVAVATKSSSGSGDQISILAGNGTGSFTPFSTANPDLFGSASIGAIAAANLSSDKYPDLVSTGARPAGSQNPTGYISVMFNNGDGQFRVAADDEANAYNTQTFPGSAITIADLNGDGLLDVAAAAPNTGYGNSAPSSVAVILNNGKGGPNYVSGFTYSQAFIATASPNEGIVVADFNKDGAPDIAVTSQLGVSLLFNTGVVSVTPSSLSWATVKLGHAGAVKSLTVKNLTTGALPLKVAYGGSIYSSPFRIWSNGCASTVAANGSCIVTVAFYPTATGRQTDVLTISDGNAILANVPVSGIGTP